MAMTTPDLSDKVLEELLAKATPGRWRDKPSVHGNQYRFVQIGKDKDYTTLEMKPDDARLAALAPSLARALMEARKEIARCHERLEIDHCWQIVEGEKQRVEIPAENRATFPDGIECRNETIKLQDENIDRLRANQDALQSKLDQIGVRCRIWAEGKVSPDTALTDIAAILQEPKP